MKIRTLWTDYGPYAGDQYTPSMLLAWDEYTIDENPEGWEEAVRKAKAQFDGQLVYGAKTPHEFRVVDIEVPGLWGTVAALFAPAGVEGRASGANPES